MIGEIADPRRFEACAYINSGGEKLEVLIALDNELWAIPSRSKEALIARIRLQFWHDEIEKIKNKEAVTTPLSNLIAANFGHEINMLEIILELIEAHIDDLEFFPKRQNEINIWEKYYKAAFKIYNIEANNFEKICGLIIANANKGDFSFYKKHAKSMNNFLKNNKNKAKILPIIANLKLARNENLYNDILYVGNSSKLGIKAKLAVFGAILFGKI